MRATSIPDWISLVNTLEESDAGPMVQTILVAMGLALVFSVLATSSQSDPIIHNTFCGARIPS
jgi:hypothetical protein